MGVELELDVSTGVEVKLGSDMALEADAGIILRPRTFRETVPRVWSTFRIALAEKL